MTLYKGRRGCQSETLRWIFEHASLVIEILLLSDCVLVIRMVTLRPGPLPLVLHSLYLYSYPSSEIIREYNALAVAQVWVPVILCSRRSLLYPSRKAAIRLSLKPAIASSIASRIASNISYSSTNRLIIPSTSSATRCSRASSRASLDA